MPSKYIKKPVVVEAVQWTGNNRGEIFKFVGSMCYFSVHKGNTPELLHIKTLEGEMLASIGDYIIKGIKDEFYPCKPDIFKLTYDKHE
jgi:hypothetical protein